MLNPGRDTVGAPLRRDLDFAPRRKRRGPGGWIVWILVLAAAGTGIWLHAHLSGAPIWAVRAVSVEGNRSIQAGELLDRLNVQPGMSWWRVRSRAAALAAAEPRLALVEVYWRWPRDLVVRVRERQGILRLLTDPPYEVAADGTLFAWEEELDPLDQPILTGVAVTGVGAQQKLRLGEAASAWDEFVTLWREAPEAWKRIGEIHYAGGRDFQIYTRADRRVILWETGINQSVKETLADVLQTLDQRGLDDVVIDLRFRDQVVLRLPAEVAADSAKAGGEGSVKAAAVTKGAKGKPATPPARTAAQGRRRA